MFEEGAPVPFMGETFALLAAMCWALALVLFKRSGESVSPLSLSLFKNVIGVILLTLTLLVVGVDQESLRRIDVRSACLLAFSGVLGIAVADTLLFYSLNIIGVGMVTITECIYTPSIVFFAWLLHSERIAPHDGIGGILVLSGVLLAASHKPPGGRTRARLLVGVLLGTVAIGMMSFGIMLVKPIIEAAPLLPVTLLRLLAGTVALAGFMAASRHRRAWFAVFHPSRTWRVSAPASILSTFLAMLFWIGGFKYTSAPVAAILNQTSTVMALVFARVILGEPITLFKLLAAGLALSGVLIVFLGG